MNYFLDTNICIYFLNGKYESVKKRLLEHKPNEIKIPAIVKAELLYGARKSKNIDDNIKRIGHFLLPFDIVPFDDAASVSYSHIRENLEGSEQIIGPNDLMIASIVSCERGILVTNNVKEFERVPELSLENWVE